MLSTILDEVAATVAESPMRDYDRFEVFGGFFFGQPKPDVRLGAVLRDSVPSSVVECTALRNDGEPVAAAAANDALFDFAFDAGTSGKKIILVCNDGCGLKVKYDVDRVSSDLALMAYLSCDLKMNRFKTGRRIGKVMARRQ